MWGCSAPMRPWSCLINTTTDAQRTRHQDMGPELDIHNPQGIADEPPAAWRQSLFYSTTCRPSPFPFPPPPGPPGCGVIWRRRRTTASRGAHHSDTLNHFTPPASRDAARSPLPAVTLHRRPVLLVSQVEEEGWGGGLVRRVNIFNVLLHPYHYQSTIPTLILTNMFSPSFLISWAAASAQEGETLIAGDVSISAVVSIAFLSCQGVGVPGRGLGSPMLHEQCVCGRVGGTDGAVS